MERTDPAADPYPPGTQVQVRYPKPGAPNYRREAWPWTPAIVVGRKGETWQVTVLLLRHSLEACRDAHEIRPAST